MLTAKVAEVVALESLSPQKRTDPDVGPPGGDHGQIIERPKNGRPCPHEQFIAEPPTGKPRVDERPHPIFAETAGAIDSGRRAPR